MDLAGTYRGFFCFMEGEVYVGELEGEPHVEFSMPAIGAMHVHAKTVEFNDEGISFVMEVNALDGTAELKEENGRLKGEMFVKEVDMHFNIDIEKVSDEYVFCEEYNEISEENREILRRNNTYVSGPAFIRHSYELENEEVLKAVKELGIDVENHNDFETIVELMLKTEEVIHQDGVNYCHSNEHGTLAQLKQAREHDNYTNCRGISIVFSGILRAYGFRSSYVECWPEDPHSREIHVVCEVYAPDLKKYIVVDISNRLIFFKDGVPLSLIELRDLIVAGEEKAITGNPEIRGSLGEILAYLSKNLAAFCKQLNNNEADEIERKNSICLAPEELKQAFFDQKNQYVTSNRNEFYFVEE